MTSNLKRPLSPLAKHGPRPHKISRTFNPAQTQVALTENPQLVTVSQSVQGEDRSPVFTFGDSRAIGSFTFTTKDATVPGAPVPDVNISSLVGGDSPPPSIPDKEPRAVSGTLVTPEVSTSTALISYPPNRLHQSLKEPIGEDAPVGGFMELAIDLGPASSSMQQEPAISGESSDEERSVLSYADEYPMDRSMESTSLSISGTKRSTPDGRRSPHMTVSSREQSLYQIRKNGPEGTLVGPLGAIGALQHPQRSDRQNSNPPACQDTPNNTTPNTGGVNSGSPVAPDVKAPYNPRGHSAPENVALGSFDPHEDTSLPTRSSAHEGAATPTTNSSIPPLRRVRFRGVFIVGNGAPIKIDESIEVHLRDGVDGQVDFVM